MAEADFRVLGVVEATVSGRLVNLGHARQRAVLAVLLVEAGRVVATGQLTHWVWDAAAPAEPRKTLYTYVSRLRGQLSGSSAEIQRYRGGYLIDIDPSAVDMHRFERFIEQARSAAGDEQAGPLWRQALELWRGDPFEDLDVPWLRAVAERLTAQHYTAKADYRDLRLRRGEHAELLPELQAAVTASPLDERLAGQFMLALYRSGRQADSLTCYDRLRRRLADELGSDPEPDTQRLYHHILTADEALAAPVQSEPVAVAGQTGPAPVTLPWDSRDFTGRDDELSQLDKLVGLLDQPSTAAAAVISGTGGVGKTALAVHWAHRQRTVHAFPDGRLYINLQGFAEHAPTTPEGALRNLLRQLGVPGAQIPSELEQAQLLFRRELANRKVLVLLDNAVDADQVRPLLVESPSLCLITSRNRLTGLIVREGAAPITLGRMPDSDANALTGRLLGEHHPDDVTARLGEVCGHLPLAIRVAATGYQTSHPDTRLADYVDQLAGDRIGMLDATADDTTAITTVLSWSTRLLPPDLREAFCHIGLHPGPRIDIPAAAAMLDTTEPRARRVVRELASASLIEETSPGCWSMHDLLADYACNGCPRDGVDQSIVYTRLLTHYTERLASQSIDHHWIHEEHGALMACLRVPVTAELTVQYALELGERLQKLSNFADAMTAYEIAGQRAAAGGHAHAQAVFGLGRSTKWSDASRAGGYLNEALQRFRQLGDKYGEAQTLRQLSEHSNTKGDYQTEYDFQALQLFRDLGDHDGEAETLTALAWRDMRTGDYRGALQRAARALELVPETGSPEVRGQAYYSAATASRHLGEYNAAEDNYATALQVYIGSGDRRGQASVLRELSNVALDTGRFEEALQHQRQALALLVEVGDRSSQSNVLHGMGRAAIGMNDLSQARDRFLEARRLCVEFEDRVGEAVIDLGLADILMSEGEHAKAAEMYRQASLVVTSYGYRKLEAQAHLGLARAMAACGEGAPAQQHFQWALEIFEEIGSPQAAEVRDAINGSR